MKFEVLTGKNVKTNMTHDPPGLVSLSPTNLQLQSLMVGSVSRKAKLTFSIGMVPHRNAG